MISEGSEGYQTPPHLESQRANDRALDKIFTFIFFVGYSKFQTVSTRDILDQMLSSLYYILVPKI